MEILMRFLFPANRHFAYISFLKTYLLFIAVCFLFCTIPTNGFAKENATRLVNEQQLKAAFLFNLIKYVKWPEVSLAGGRIDLGILGKIMPGNPLHSLNDKIVGGRKIHIKVSNDADDLTDCHILYIQHSEQKQLRRIIPTFGNAPILTVSDIDGFITSHNGMVAIELKDGKIIFSINLKQGRNTGLDFSSYLLRLATKVYQ